MNLSIIREDLAVALADVIPSVARHRGGRIDGFPAAVIDVDTVTPDSFGEASHAVQCTIRVMVSKADTADAWDRLDDLLSSNLIGAALRGSGQQVTVDSYDNVGVEVEYDDGVALGFTVAVTVIA